MLDTSSIECDDSMAKGIRQYGRNAVSPLRKLMQFIMPGEGILMESEDSGIVLCAHNCSGHGECRQGICVCEVEYSGTACDNPNLSYHLAFSTIFFILSAISFLQLLLCINSEFKRLKPHSLSRALRITTQKTLYTVVGIASAIRGFYFQAGVNDQWKWASYLRSAYYPLVLSGSSLLVCFWAEMFHLQDVSTDRPGFLSKSFCGFALFNVITYSLFFAELFLLKYANSPNLDPSTCLGIFNGIYASLMLVVVVFFLIYGVEVYFKVRGAFIHDEFPVSDRSQLHQSRLGLVSQAILLIFTVLFLLSDVMGRFWQLKVPLINHNTHQIMFQIVELAVALWFPCCLWNCFRPEQLWILNPRRILKKGKKRVLSKRRCLMKSGTIESQSFIGEHAVGYGDDQEGYVVEEEEEEGLDNQSKLECWICYDNEKKDLLIQPCKCKGDVSAVHHECLKHWLMESHFDTEHIRCQVCKELYNFSRGQIWLPAGLTLNHYLRSALIFSVMIISFIATYAIIQRFEQVSVRTVTVGILILIEYICLRFLGINLISAYHRAKFAAIRISGHILESTDARTPHPGHLTTDAQNVNVSDINVGTYRPLEPCLFPQSKTPGSSLTANKEISSLEHRNKLLTFIRASLTDQRIVAGSEIHSSAKPSLSENSQVLLITHLQTHSLLQSNTTILSSSVQSNTDHTSSSSSSSHFSDFNAKLFNSSPATKSSLLSSTLSLPSSSPASEIVSVMSVNSKCESATGS